MSSEHPEHSSQEQRLHEILDRYLRAVEAGQAPDRQDLLARHPDLAQELADFFEDHDRMHQLAQPLRKKEGEGLPAVDSEGDTSIWPAEAPTSESATLVPDAHTDPGVGSTVQYIGDYEILGELGRGGMGVVYKARQSSLKRTVALKMILGGSHASEQDLARFRAEAEAIARLQHPHIVQIHEIGEHQGNPYTALEFVEGGSLDGKLDGRPLPAPQAAQLVEVLARAVHAAHQQGIVHRDLKPANVLLALSDRPQAIPLGSEPVQHYEPKITDFGLAKLMKEETGQTQSGTILGTPSYMAPEQAAGRSREVGPEVDIYALGAILYELLTGQPPFRAATPLDTIVQVVADEPAPPKQLNADVPRDLQTICLKCLRKDPERRYASAAALADDLHRFLTDEPIRARTERPEERLGRWIRKHPGIAVLRGTTLLLVLAWFLYHLICGLVIGSETSLLVPFTVLAVLAATLGTRLRPAAVAGLVLGFPIMLVALEVVVTPHGAVEQWLSDAAQVARYLGDWNKGTKDLQVWDDLRGVLTSGLKPDGVQAMLLVPCLIGGFVAVLIGGLWRLGVLPTLLGGPLFLVLIALFLSSHMVGTGLLVLALIVGIVSRLAAWLAQGTVIDACCGALLGIGFGTLLGQALFRGPEWMVVIPLVCPLLGAVVGALGSSSLARHALVREALESDMRQLLDPKPSSAQAEQPLEKRSWRWYRKPVLTGLLVLMLSTLAVGTFVSTYYARKNAILAEQRQQEAEAAHQEAATARHAFTMNLAWHEWQAGNLGLTAQLLDDADPTLTGWEHDFLNFLCAHKTLVVPSTSPETMSFSSDGTRLVTIRQETGEDAGGNGRPRAAEPISLGNQVTIWNLEDGSRGVSFRVPGTRSSRYEQHHLDPTGQRLALRVRDFDPKTNTRSYQMQIFDVASGQKRIVCERPDFYQSLAFSPDGKSLAAGAHDEVRVWNADTGTIRFECRKKTRTVVTCVRFNPDNRQLASAHGDHVQVWDAHSGKEIHSFSVGKDSRMRSVAFSPDSKQLFAAGGFVEGLRILGQEAVLWDLGTGKELWRYRKKGLILERALHKGQQLLAVSRGGEVLVWALDGNQPGLPERLLGGVRHPRSVALSQDGNWLALASSSITVKDKRGIPVKLTSLRRRDPPFARVPALKGEILDVALSPDGRYVAAAAQLSTRQGEFRLWDRRKKKTVPTPDLNQVVRKVAFSPDGTFLAVASLTWKRGRELQSGQVVIWEPGSDRARATFAVNGDWVRDLTFDPQGNRLAVAIWGTEGRALRNHHSWGEVLFWDVRQNALAHRLRTASFSSCKGVAFHPKDDLLAAGVTKAAKKHVHIWEGEGMHPRQTLEGGAEHVAFSPDGKLLLGVHNDSVSIWNWAAGQRLTSHSFRDDGVNSVAFTPDCRRFVTIGNDGSVRFWDPKTGQEMFVLRGLSAPGTCLDFTPDGRRLVCGAKDGSILIWEAAPEP